MQLPAILPDHLLHYQTEPNDAALSEKLDKKLVDLVLFFESASEDEIWCAEHTDFMRSALESLSKHYLNEHLSQESAGRIAFAIYNHLTESAQRFIPSDISVQAQGYSLPVNSLLFGASSEHFRDLIRIQCRDEGKEVVSLQDDVSQEFLITIVELVKTGTVRGIWKYDKKELFNLLRQAASLKLLGLMHICEDTLKRYINSENVFDILKMAYDESWEHLKQHCYDFLNARNPGIRLQGSTTDFGPLEVEEIKPLGLEFFELNESSLDIYQKLKPLVTHLIFSGSLTENPEFSRIVRSCPHLISLDISRSRSSSQYLMDLPLDLQELDLSQCPWLTDAVLKKMIGICPNLKKIVLGSNVQLTYEGFSELQKLKRLYGLDISRSPRIRDDDFLLILKACFQISHLLMEDCPQLSNKAFFEISRGLPSLAILNISRCSISDGLLLEITAHCSQLRYLNVSRCLELTGKGLLQVIRQGRKLQVLDVRNCTLSRLEVEKLREVRPLLKILS